MIKYVKAVAPIAILGVLNSLPSPLEASRQGQDMPGLQEAGTKLRSSPIKQDKKLTDIRELRQYFHKGNLEITPDNHTTLLNFSYDYETAFCMYDKGVIVKGWKASSGLEPLLDLLFSFTSIKVFRLSIDWDAEGDANYLITKSIQFYENLEELDLENCHLTDTHMDEIRETIAFPSRLKILNVRKNPVNEATLKKLQRHFVNLTNLQCDINIPPIPKDLPTPTPTVAVEELLKNLRVQSPSDYEQGKKHLANKNYELAKLYIKKAAVEGDVKAQGELGWLYHKGYLGSPENHEKARKWLGIAANQGNANAFNTLGSLYYDGLGGPKDFIKARECFEVAASRGVMNAVSNLGVLYKNGHGVHQDYAKAKEYLTKAASCGNPIAQVHLGHIYHQGLGVAQDYAQAKAWYEKSAAQGNTWAKEQLEILKVQMQTHKQKLEQMALKKEEKTEVKKEEKKVVKDQETTGNTDTP